MALGNTVRYVPNREYPSRPVICRAVIPGTYNCNHEAHYSREEAISIAERELQSEFGLLSTIKSKETEEVESLPSFDELFILEDVDDFSKVKPLSKNELLLKEFGELIDAANPTKPKAMRALKPGRNKIREIAMGNISKNLTKRLLPSIIENPCKKKLATEGHESKIKLDEQTSSLVFKEQLVGGAIVFSKPLVGIDEQMARDYNMVAADTFRHEFVARLIAEKMGGDYEKLTAVIVPRTIMVGEEKTIAAGSVCVNGVALKEVIKREDFENIKFNKQQQKTLALYDSVIGNLDRNSNNFYVDANSTKDNVIVTGLFDHGFSLPIKEFTSEVGILPNYAFIGEHHSLKDEDVNLLENMRDNPSDYGFDFLDNYEKDGVMWRIDKMLKTKKTLKYTDF